MSAIVITTLAALLTVGTQTSTVSAQLNATATATVQSGGNPPSGDPPGAPPDGGGAGGGISSTNPVLSTTCGAMTIDGKTETVNDGQAYDSTASDQSAVCLINAASLTLTNPTITKTGDSSSSDQSSFYGLNAAVLAGSGSTLTISGGTVTTDGSGTNGVFSTGDGTTVTLSDMTIEAHGDGAHAVMATLGGKMVLTNVTMNTTDAHSGAVATDRGSGTILVTGGKITTSGQDSPGIYSTGEITVTGATVIATGAESAVIEGANSITLIDTDLSSTLDGKWGVMIYQSFSGDAEGTHGVFTMTGGSLANTAATGPLFFVTNSTATITLDKVDVNAASGILVQAAATDRWGQSGSNGGTVNLTANEQTLKGDLVADSISTLNVALENGSTLTGAINAENTAKSTTVTLDNSSTWKVTADSHLTCVVNAKIVDGTVTNIVGNGHTVYYDKSACADLGGNTYALTDGGSLQPAN